MENRFRKRCHCQCYWDSGWAAPWLSFMLPWTAWEVTGRQTGESASHVKRRDARWDHVYDVTREEVKSWWWVSLGVTVGCPSLSKTTMSHCRWLGNEASHPHARTWGWFDRRQGLHRDISLLWWNNKNKDFQKEVRGERTLAEAPPHRGWEEGRCLTERSSLSVSSLFKFLSRYWWTELIPHSLFILWKLG